MSNTSSSTFCLSRNQLWTCCIAWPKLIFCFGQKKSVLMITKMFDLTQFILCPTMGPMNSSGARHWHEPNRYHYECHQCCSPVCLYTWNNSPWIYPYMVEPFILELPLYPGTFYPGMTPSALKQPLCPRTNPSALDQPLPPWKFSSRNHPHHWNTLPSWNHSSRAHPSALKQPLCPS